MNEVQKLNSDEFKAATRSLWDRHAQGWNDSSARIRDWLRDSTGAMLEMANVQPGARVLDVAAGAGDQTLDIAKRVGPDGFVLATDLSPAILAFAKDNATQAGFANVETLAVDGEALAVPDASFDAAICRLGLMFFPDPGRGLQAMFRALKPGGMAATMVFSTPDKNPCGAILVSTALKHAGLPPRDPYQPGGLLSLGKPGLIDELFRQAGFPRWRRPRSPHRFACRRSATISTSSVPQRARSCRFWTGSTRRHVTPLGRTSNKG